MCFRSWWEDELSVKTCFANGYMSLKAYCTVKCCIVFLCYETGLNSWKATWKVITDNHLMNGKNICFFNENLPLSYVLHHYNMNDIWVLKWVRQNDSFYTCALKNWNEQVIHPFFTAYPVRGHGGGAISASSGEDTLDKPSIHHRADI